MPQLDPSSYLSQLFWLVITFGVLYLTMARMTLPQISKVLQNRQTRISSDLDKAEAMRKEASSVSAEYEAALAETRAKAAAVTAAAKAKAEEEASRKREELEKVVQKKLSDADKRMQETFNRTMSELRPLAADLAALVVKQVTGKGVNSKQAENAISTVIKERVND